MWERIPYALTIGHQGSELHTIAQCSLSCKSFSANVRPGKMNNFTNNDSGGNPCPLIKKIVGTCADNVKVKWPSGGDDIVSIFRVPFQVCFDAQGWERGQKIFFDQLALQYPQINECDLFNGTDLTHRDPGQKCSIAEEVGNGREVADCTNKLQVDSLVL